MTSISFENDKDGFSTARPDWDLVHERVRAAINPPPPVSAPPASSAPAPTPSVTAQPEPTASGRPEPTPSAIPTPAPPSSVEDECAYNPAPYPGAEG